MVKRRYFHFHPEHWKGDVALCMCSMAARGLWVAMICEMHSGKPYGHLVTPTGIPIGTPGELASIVGQKATDVARWLKDLDHAGVFSRTEAGVIYSRRMVRDYAARAEWRDAKRKGGGKGSVFREVSDDFPPSLPTIFRGVSDDFPIAEGKGYILTPDGVSGPPALSGEKNPSWDAELGKAIDALLELRLDALTAEQRTILGRYHALAFGRCTTEATNRRKGAQLAGTFGTMAGSPEFGDLLVDEYLILARKYFALQGGSPWFKPFEIKAVAPVELLSRRNGVAH